MISCYPLPISRRRLAGNAGQCGPPPTALCLFSRTSRSNFDLLHHLNIYRQPVRFFIYFATPCFGNVHKISTYLPPTYLSTYLPKASTDCPFTDLMGRSVTIANNNPGPLCHDTDQWQWHIIIIMSDLSPVTSVGCRARAEPSSTGRRPTPPASRTTPPPPATRRTTMTTRRRTATTRTLMDSTETPSD